ncbi:MAG TPA: ABC transporter ATP-binding protein [Povalibacter sp.]|nr:ABC transporter ATP-binding protein [Povalibacter sp.]
MNDSRTDSVLSTQHLGKTIGGRAILSDISVSLDRGDVVGVIGKNGAGKTTLLETVLGFSPATAGSSQIYGHDSFMLPAAVKSRVGFVPQQDDLMGMLTGKQQLGLVAALYGGWDSGLIDRLAGEWEVPLQQRIATLSGGERQKLSTLLALGHRPDLLVLDEPVSSLDPIARRRFLQQILEYTADQQRTVLFSSHIVSDLERVANRIWIIRDGQMIWQGDLDALKESVVRLHVRASQPLPASLDIPHTLFEQVTGTSAVVAVSHWEQSDPAAVSRRLNADIEVEALGLEDIFLELNR